MISMERDNASGFRGGTINPVLPTSIAMSPTSVPTHGVPHAIASATTFGKASLLEAST